MTDQGNGNQDHWQLLGRTLQSLCNICYILNYTKQSYCFFSATKEYHLPEQGSLQQLENCLAGLLASAADIDAYFSILNPTAAERAFFAGQNHITVTVQRKEGQCGSCPCTAGIIHISGVQGEDLLAFGYLQDIIGATGQTQALNEGRRLEKYQAALQKAYLYLCDIDVQTGRYTLLGGYEAGFLPEEGDYEERTRWIAEFLVHPEDREKWLNTFCFSALKAALGPGEREVSLDYRVRGEDGDYTWRSSTAVWVERGPGSPKDSIVVFAQPADQKKQAEELNLKYMLLDQRMAYQKDLALREERYRVIVDQTGAEVFEWDSDPNALDIICGPRGSTPWICGSMYVSQRLLDEFAVKQGGNLLKDLLSQDRVWLEDWSKVQSFLHEINRGGYRELLCRLKCRNTDYRWHKLSVTAMEQDGGTLSRLIGTVQDVHDEIYRNQQLYLSNQRYQAVLQKNQIIEFEYNLSAQVSYVSPLFDELFGVDSHGIDLRLGLKKYLHIYEEDQELYQEFYQAVYAEERNHEVICRIYNRNNAPIWCKLTMTCLYDAEGKLQSYLGTIQDVDEEKRTMEALKTKAESDFLTGLLNQGAFYEQADGILSSNAGRQYAFISLDIDKFKFINNLYGMEVGDLMLGMVGEVIKKRMKPGDLCARLYADVFCMLVEYGEDRELIALMQGIIADLNARKVEYNLAPSFGVCRADRELSAAGLCEMAGFARKSIKESYLQRWAFYSESVRQQALNERQMENEMSSALHQRQFEVYYQPKCHLVTGKLVGAEALVRWNHPERGMVPPGDFIPLFEKNGFILELDAYVWDQVCRQLRHWLDEGKTPLPISVNVSRLHIYNPKLRETLIKLMEVYRLPRNLLELELTESMFLDNPEALVASLAELQHAGFTLAMDDFGSGYSSLNMLKNLPIDELKLDYGFLSETAATRKGKTVVRHVIDLAIDLDLRVVAEGVETAEQAEFLRQCGCQTAQGFYYSRPLPLREFERIAFLDYTAMNKINGPLPHGPASR